MTLYHQCLVFVVLNDDYEIHDLPHTIVKDVTVLQKLKNKLEEWNDLSELLNDIQLKIDYDCYYRSCNCSFLIDCECESFNDYEITDEQEWLRLTQEKEAIKKKLDELEEKISHVKDKMPVCLKDVARKIVKNLNYQWICFLNINLQ